MRPLKPSQVQKHTRLKIYNTLALFSLFYGCETWAIRDQDNVSGNEICEEVGKTNMARPMKIFDQKS